LKPFFSIYSSERERKNRVHNQTQKKGTKTKKEIHITHAHQTLTDQSIQRGFKFLGSSPLKAAAAAAYPQQTYLVPGPR
jgi:hypothetical protein